jgi:hypothetical protein
MAMTGWGERKEKKESSVRPRPAGPSAIHCPLLD